jgi:NAD(P)-dependent dehydrogenase (short-subunit alcohol dehydrogenase family)
MAASFAEKVVVVSGGSRGIGRAIGLAFACAGAQVVLAASSAANLAAASSAIVAAGGQEPLAVAADLRTPQGCGAVFERVNGRFGRCDILVNNAGATRSGEFTDLADDVWVDGFALKFFGAVRLSRLFWPLLVAAQGHVVNIVGTAARTPTAEFMIGASVNAAFASFSKGLSRLGMRDGVNVNAILPGDTDTERSRGLLEHLAAASGRSIEELLAAKLEKSGVRRIGTPEDVAALALFLCSDAARHIQGTSIAVDGGSTPGVY